MNNLGPDLPEKWLNIIKNILEENLPQRKIWLYGSRANGTACESSDIDLVFFPPKHPAELTNDKLYSLEMNRQLQLKELFRDSNLPVFVDILSWMVLPDDFKKQIESENYISI